MTTMLTGGRNTNKRTNRLLSYAAQGAMEGLEARQLLSGSPLVVSNLNDSGTGSLRDAIMCANSTSGPDTISFNITDGAPDASGVWRILLQSPLPTISGSYPLTIDGTTQPGYSGSAPVVGIGPASGVSIGIGLNVNSVGNLITGLRVDGFGTGIAINGDFNVVQNSWIGLDKANTDGVVINGSEGLIGGTTAAERNVISNNANTGITVGGSALDTVIEGNYVGTDKDGSYGISSHTSAGILVMGGSTTIGGTVAGAANVISGNANGIIFDSAMFGTIQGNLIGVDATGLNPVDNSSKGIWVSNSSFVTIGGGGTGEGNIIGANDGNAVRADNAEDLTIQGNIMGLAADGNTALWMTGDVVYVTGDCTDLMIGGEDPGTGNVISGGLGNGIWMDQFDGTNAVIQGNLIGTTADGSLTEVGNSGDGIRLSSASGVLIKGNTIAGNSGNGVHLTSTLDNSNVQDTITSNSIYANAELGIHLGDFGEPNPAPTPPHLPAGQPGPNLYQNYPALGPVNRGGSTVTISGSLQAGADTQYVLEFFGNDPSLTPVGGYAQGQRLIGTRIVNTTPGTSVNFSFTFTVDDTSLTEFTATATDPVGNTSEFSASASQTVISSLAPTTTTVASSVNPSQFHQAVTFTATVTYNPLAGTPDSPIQFFDGTTFLGSVANPVYSAGHATATFTTSTLALGTHNITATFMGDAHFNTSTSLPLVQNVDARITTTTLDSSQNPSVYHQTVTFTATVSSAVSTPTGTVSFFDDGGTTLLWVSTLSNGVATFTTNNLEVGSHHLTASYSGDAAHSSSGALLTQTVNKASPVLTWNNPAAITYGTPLSGAQLNATADVAGSFVYTPASGSKLSAGAGQTLSVLFNPTDTAHYLSVTKSVSIDVNKAVLTVTPADASRVYGQANPSFSATISGFVNGETLSTSGVSGSAALSSAAVASSNVGDYAITASAGTLAAANYSFVFAAGTLHVTKASIVVTANDGSRMYGAGNPVLSGSISGVVAGDAITTSYSTAANALSNVGSYPISASLLDPDGRLGNYTVDLHDGTLTVTAAPLLVSSPNVNKVYGDSIALGGSMLGLLNQDNISASFSSAGAAAGAPASGSPYAIFAALSDPDGRLMNYTVSYDLGQVSVSKAHLVVVADDASKTYGDANPSFTASISGFVAGDDTSALDGVLSFSTEATVASHVGSYAITPGGVSSANYDVSFVDGNLDVDPAQLTITADDKTMVYGGAMPALTASFSGFVNGDTPASLSSLILTTVRADSGVGGYPIFADGVGADYVVTPVPGTLTITPAHLTVMAGDASRAYGAVNPAFSFTVSGFVNNDTASVLSGSPSLSSSANPASPVGRYDIVAGAGSLSAANYALDFVNGKLNVTKAALSVSADNASRTYGAANPAFTGTIAGLLNSDNITASYSSSADAQSNVGSYDIVVSLNNPDGRLANYDVTVSNGTLTVGAASTATSLSASKSSANFGDSVTFTATVSSAAGAPNAGTVTFSDGSTNFTANVVDGVATWTTTTLSLGAHSVVATYNGSDNFDGSVSSPVVVSVNNSAFTMSGKVLRDTTGNGLSDDDTALANVTVKVYADTNHSGAWDSGDAVAATLTSDSGGNYSFSTTTNGRYFIKEMVPGGFLLTAPTNSSGYYTVNVTGSGSIAHQDFDNFEQCNCSDLTDISYVINGTTTVTNLRGNTHQGDVVTAYFTVPAGQSHRISLVSYTAPDSYFDANDADQQKIYQLATDVFGPGRHSMTVTLPDAYYQVDFVCGFAIDKLGPNGSNVFYTPQGRLISADNGGVNPYIANSSSISGFVYVDANNDGVKQVGESVLSGVTVKLYDASSHLVATTTTDPNGRYAFPNLLDGSYSVVETQPSGYMDGAKTLGDGGGTITSTGFAGIGVSSLSPGSKSNYNFGELKNASLSGSVYYDKDNDGLHDNGETGLANVTLKLVNASGQVVATTTTNSSGNYTFSNVAPGTYTILETQPSGYVDGIESAGSLGGDDTGDNNTIAAIPVAFGQTGINYNFGELKEVSVDSGDTATIGFWNNKNGQNLIKSFNGSANARNLGNWLAATFPNIYGVAGASTYAANKTNTQVAAIFQALFKVSGQKLDAQVMAVALACYTTDKDLGGTAGSKYGFDLSATGTAAKCYNIGSNGAAFDVANNSVITVLDALSAADRHASNAVLYGGNSSLRNMANTVFNGINNTGDID